MTFLAKYFGSSGWLIELDDFRILIDPWLRGDLVFSPGPWLIKGQLKKLCEIPDSINLLLLTQGLPDHSHPSSLEVLDRSIPVIGSSGAAKVAENLGFNHVHQLNPGQNKIIDNVSVQATAGAPVPLLENGYIVTTDIQSFYIEPHGFLDQTIIPCNVDAVISPVVNLKIPLLGSFIKGKSVLPKLLEVFNPRTVLSTTTGGDAVFSGLLNNLISVDGSFEEASKIISRQAKFINPVPGITYKLEDFNQ